MANYAVGDIQGCFKEFKEGLELINFKSSKDFLWITGDLINRGPDSFKVLEYVFKIKNSVHIVLGNHDLHYLNCYQLLLLFLETFRFLLIFFFLEH